MIITVVKKSKKGNILIYADGSYLASIDPEVFLKHNLKVGSYIDDDIIKELSEEISLNKAKEKALRLLSMRAHSKKELESKITRSLGEEYAKKASSKMEELGLINDKEFAISYAKELIFRKFHSISRTKLELAEKGVSNDIIDSVIDEINPNEEENIKNILEKKYFSKGKSLKDEKEFRKAVSYCQRLGYNWYQIKRVVSFFDNE